MLVLKNLPQCSHMEGPLNRLPFFSRQDVEIIHMGSSCMLALQLLPCQHTFCPANSVPFNALAEWTFFAVYPFCQTCTLWSFSDQMTSKQGTLRSMQTCQGAACKHVRAHGATQEVGRHLGQLYAPALQWPLKVDVWFAVRLNRRLRLPIHVPKLHQETHHRLHELLQVSHPTMSQPLIS